MKRCTFARPFPLMHALVLGSLTTFLAHGALAGEGWLQTGAGPFDYNEATNWDEGDINGIFPSALTLGSNQAVTFGADTALTTGLLFDYTGGFGLTLRSDGGGARTLTLGGDIIMDTTSNVTVTFGSNSASQALDINLGASRTFDITSSRSLTFINTITSSSAAHEINVVGGGTMNLGGPTGNAAGLGINVTNSTLSFLNNSNNSTYTGTTRAASVTLNGSTLNVNGNTTVDSIDTITGALNIGQGASNVGVSPNSQQSLQLTADSLTREVGGTVLFRGNDLGVNTVASQTNGAASITFTGTSPTLTGSGAAGTSTVGIIKGAFGDTVNGGAGRGLVTYDTDYGVRLLDTATEYTSAIVDGQTTLDNVRYANVTETGSLPITTTINDDTTIHSLSFDVTGAFTGDGAAIELNGTGTLNIESGMIFARQVVSGSGTSANDVAHRMYINGPVLDFGGGEAVIYSVTNGTNGGANSAALRIDSEITNASSLTKSGSGVLHLAGETANTYTGLTIMNSGTMHLQKTGAGANGAIVGDLLINGGTVFGSSNQIADTSNVTINGGTYDLRPATNSGSSSSDVINNLTLSAGKLTAGSGTSGGTLAVNNATLSGGTASIASRYSMNVGGQLAMSGAEVTIAGSVSTAGYLANLNVDGGLTISNTAKGAYTAITANAGTDDKFGGRIGLNSNLTFVGNQTNSNTVTIATTEGVNSGVMDLGTETRTFNIGDGAAKHDLTVQTAIISTTETSGVVKTGAGTIALTGNSTYTGTTLVSQGVLIVGVGGQGSLGATAVTVQADGELGGSGAIAGTVEVQTGGTLSPGNSPGTLSTGAQVWNEGGNLNWQMADAAGLAGTGYDTLNITGTLDLSALTEEEQFNINLWSLSGTDPDVDGLAANFDASLDQFWTLATTTSGILGFDADAFLINVAAVNGTGGFANDLAGGEFSVSVAGNDLRLNFTAVPEPSAALLALVGLAAVAARRRRR